MNEQEFAELAAGAALRALSADDERRFRDALTAHPEWRAIAEADAEVTDTLYRSVPPVEAPAHIRSALLAQIATMPQESAASSSAPASDLHADTAPAEPRSDDDSGKADPPAGVTAETRAPVRRWTRAVFALAACLAVLVGVGIGAVALNSQLNRPQSVIALEQIQSADDAQQETVELGSGGTATAHWSASTGQAVLVADGIPAPAEGRTYELWFVRGDGPVPAGVFDVEDGRATAVLDGEMQAGDAIAVTVEQAGGSPAGKPTTDPVIVIPTA